ncbi:MAG: 5-(carboxyamino)imidazole ribonucleotide synthase [Elainellaceae cyanobacterium]
MRVGVIGGGQLAWMMGRAARSLNIDLIIQTPSAADPAVAIAADTILAPVDDAIATARLAQCCDVITFENEFIDIPALQVLPHSQKLFRPRLEALAPLVDKLDQRQYLQSLGLPLPRFMALDAAAQIAPDSVNDPSIPLTLSFPLVLKARRHGYDGKGTHVVRTPDELRQVVSPEPAPDRWMLEEFVPFERELAVMVARGTDGAIAVYPVVESVQVEQVCRRVVAGVELPPAVVQQARAIAQTILQSLDVVGLFGIELFLTADNRVLINEIAPRTHNSGHYTLDACATSQFEQLLRAVGGLPLGDAALQWPGALMVNLLGYEDAESDYEAQRQQLAQVSEATVYWYGKRQSRPGRKLGHVTVRLSSDRSIDDQVAALSHQIDSIWYPRKKSENEVNLR